MEVDGISVAAAEAIQAGSVVSGYINEGTGHLILVQFDETEIDAGLVVPPTPIIGTLAEYNTALSDGDFVSLIGVETLTNKTLESPVITGIGQVQTAYKTADEPLTSTTALQDDNHLTFTVVANAVYALWGRLFVTGESGQAIRLAWSMPALAVVSGQFGLAAGNVLYEASSDTQVNNGTTSGSTLQLPLEFIFTTGANAGTVKFRWAQDTSDVDALTVKIKSFIVVRRLA